MVSFEIFVKSMPPSLSELKVLPSFCFAFKIPDDVAVTIIYKGINPMGLLVLFYLSQICTRFGIRGQARIVFLMAYFVATSFLSASLGKVSIQPIRET